MTKLKKLLIIGPILPPIGGISIHIDRLVNLFSGQFEIDYIDEAKQRKEGIFNLRGLNLVQYFKRIRSADIIFIHSVTRIQRYFHLIASRFSKGKSIFSVHTYPKALRFPYGYTDPFIFNMADRIIFVNQDMKSFLKIPDKKVFIKHAFLPPMLENEKELSAGLIKSIEKARRDGRTIVGSNGWKLQMFNREDMYGLDLCLEAVRMLADKEIKLFFIFNISTIEGVEDYYNSSQEKIKNYNLKNSFLLLNENLSFVKLIEQADITVRATNTDGDSLSVRESLFFNKPVIASDVVERPAGVTLFKTRDAEDLADKLEEFTRNKRTPFNEPAESLNEIKRFYNEIFSI